MKNWNKTTYLNLALIAIFLILFLLRQNFEFLFYAAGITILVFIIEKTDKIFKYSSIAKIGFSIWLLLHFLGGYAYINKTRLYDLILIPLLQDPINILRYDQVIHAYCYFVISLFVYAIIKQVSKEKSNKLLLAILSVLAAMGIGVVNEIGEFISVVFFNAGEAVGDYFNNALDLIFNFIGSIIALIFLRFRKHL